ncbi:mis18-binding protein 1 isoform X2 [Dunckerocampus dactyliophorus]|uniref:mis18-binding protein 1 isoform X2 n=1 Tax=Dunckerocampus dactyliophorus TaxID=161453 RepID=UPI0024050C07|nr:mis18-binding protein 1 isoform X2 [Dunckerocampus dactyliophorus]
MASCRHSSARFESPAKVFAKMKSKVQREAMCANEGGFIGKDQTFGVREEEHGEDFSLPRRITEGIWEANDLKQNHRVGQLKALTLSPIKSPRKCYSAVEIPHMTNAGNGFQSTNGHLMESTAVFHSHLKADQCSTRDLAVCNGTTRTPVKKHVDISFGRLKGFAPLDASVPQDTTYFSPTRKKLKKRKLVEQEMDKASRSTNARADQENDNSNMEDLQSEEEYPFATNRDTCEPVHAHPKYARMTRFPEILMSPAKIFAYMKERENRRELEQDSEACREPLHDGEQTCHSPASNLDKMDEDDVSITDLHIESPVTQPRPKFGNYQSDMVHPEEASSSVVTSEPILFEDPIVLNTPRVTIPKKHKAEFKNKQWPNPEAMTSESVIHLNKWFLRRNRKGLFVDGIRVGHNIPWNSNIVVERLSSTALKTVSGRVYILVGKINMDVDSEFPMWLLRKFVNGFPENWKELFEKFLSESKDRGKKFNGEGRSRITRTMSETTALAPTMKRSKKDPVRTSDSCLPSSSSSSAKVSRSGRLIKPPLEYWKGGRVILDADMNVTIFECYDTSICSYNQVAPAVSSGPSRKSAHALQHSDKGRKQHESSSDGEPRAALRKVKAPLSQHKQVEQIQPEEDPHVLNRAAVQRRTHPTTSFDEQSNNEKTLTSQSETKKHPVRASKKKTSHAEVPPLAVSLRKRTNNHPYFFDDYILEYKSLDEEEVATAERKKQGNRKQRQRGRKLATSKSCPEEREKELREPGWAPKTVSMAQAKPKHTKSVKPAPPAKAPAEFTQPKKKSNKGRTVQPQVEEEDTWTQDELSNLQQAVSRYPKHVSSYWEKVAMMVGTRSAKECYNKHMVCRDSPSKSTYKTKKNKVKVPKDQDCPVISAKIGTFKRKQQVRQFLETMPREDMDDAFSASCMQNKRFEMPSISSSKDEDFTLGNVAPLTPISSGFPEVKTPQCLSITPGMMVSPNSNNNNDKYVFQLQKRMKINQLNVYKQFPAKSLSPTASVKRTMKRCENSKNHSFVVWEMFPEKASLLSESGEEDFYFSDDN